jgi:ATP-dependent Clp protease ATP-binding subunit ClpA
MTMFERFTPPARRATREAWTTATAAKAAEVAPEHVLAGLLAQPRCNAVELLARCGCGPDQHTEVLLECRDFRRRGGIGRAEAEALRGLGIEVDAIIDRVEEIWGEGALQEPVPPEPVGRMRRRRGQADRGRGGPRMPWGREAKRVLETSLRQALDLKSESIGSEHVLLGLLVREGAVREVLTARGVTPLQVRALIQAGGTSSEHTTA